jgi:hypothetical protein
VEATTQFNTIATSRLSLLSLFEKKDVSCVLTVMSADFRNREEELKNALATSRGKVRDLEIKVR